MTRVIVASTSEAKIKGVETAFERKFENVSVRGYKTESGVPDQPFGDDVLKGAMNRLERLKENPETKFADYLVACEGGVIESCGMYFNVQFVVIEDFHGIARVGMSQGLQIPPQYIEAVRSDGLASVMDSIFDKAGGVRVLSDGQMTRSDLVEASAMLALGAFKW
ncbi:MAG: DUF84 family protein [Clostridia bacterium]|nr:DUF84 family protein [Clostridia bacterium]